MSNPCIQADKMAEIKERVSLTNNDIAYMKQEISEIKTNQKETNDKIDKLINRLDTKFASKRVEWVVKWLVWVILLGVSWAILKLVII